MTLQSWWLFVVAVFLLCGTPGPNMLHVMRRAIDVGIRRSLATMAGCLTAILLVLAASAGGLAAILAAAPRLFDALRYAGVAYLLYLGVKAWRGDGAPIDIAAPLPATTLRAGALFRGGLLIGLSNPKLILFATAFLPQFINRSAPQGAQFAILVATFVAIEGLWYTVYALGGRRIARHLTRPAMRKLFDRITGAIFVGFGLALLGARV